MKKRVYQRLWELDFLRGLAILLMIAFHLVFDLKEFFSFEKLNYKTGFWYYEGKFSAMLFVLLAGITSSLIYQRGKDGRLLKKNALRGFRLILLGLFITLATFIFARNETIWFGILHFLGLAILITIPLLSYRWINVFLAGLIFLLYPLIQNLHPTNYLGLIFGLLPYGFNSYDHYSLIPWLSYFLIGIALGNWIYKDDKKLIERNPTSAEKQVMRLGKYSLWIYLLHQPLLLLMLWMIFRGGKLF